jgi:hypothetical protein
MAAAAAAAPALLPPLPQIEGPRLEPFLDDIEKHNYTVLEFLGAGAHSAVLRIQINNVIYVVKFVSTKLATIPFHC